MWLESAREQNIFWQIEVSVGVVAKKLCENNY